jgi:hypothetical protein
MAAPAAYLQQNLPSWLKDERPSTPHPVAPRRFSGDGRGPQLFPARAASIGGIVNSTTRSRHGPTTRSRQSRNAVGSQANAISTALRVSASSPPASRRRPAGGIARPAPHEPPAPVPHPLFGLFYQVEIRHRQLLQRQSRTRSGCGCLQGCIVFLWQFNDCHYHKQGSVGALCGSS